MKIAATIERHSMFGRGARIGVAVSGGADSVALLHMLRELEWGLSLEVLHLNHGLRGAESDEDAEFVRTLAARLGLPCVIERVSLDPSRGNLEQMARRERLGFFQRMKAERSLDRVATAHTMSDQAETVLFRLLRGAGATGLAGILPVTAEGLVRPLLEISRHDVLGYLERNGFAWREDRSNRDPKFARNRIRHELLPQLERDWNPNLTGALAHTATVALDEERDWNLRISAEWERLTEPHPRGVILRGAAAKESPAFLRRLVREAIRRTKGDLARIEFVHVESVCRMLGAGEPRRAGLPGVEALRWRGAVLVAIPAAPYSEPVPASGTVHGVRVVLEQTGYNEDGRDLLDADRVSGQLILRNWMPGDAYRPTGHASVKKVNDLFQSARVPLWDRQDWPIIASGGNIVWTKRFGASVESGCTAATRRVWRVIVEK